MDITYQSAVVFCQGISASRHFYEDLLGQEVEMDVGPSIGFKGGFGLWQADHAVQTIHERAPEDTESLGRAKHELYFETMDLETASTRLSEGSVEFVHPLREQPWCQRVLCVYDPDRHIVEVGEPMPAVIARLLGEGLSVEAVVEQTGMPIEVVKQVAATHSWAA